MTFRFDKIRLRLDDPNPPAPSQTLLLKSDDAKSHEVAERDLAAAVDAFDAFAKRQLDGSPLFVAAIELIMKERGCDEVQATLAWYEEMG